MRPLLALVPLVWLVLPAAPLAAQAARDLPARLADREGWRVWESAGFRLELDFDLPEADLARLARVADRTAAAVREHPLPLWAPPDRGRPVIEIHGRLEGYLAAGAVEGSSGHYDGRRGRVVVRGSYLLSDPSGGRSRLAPAHNEDLLVHEIVHLCMHQRLAVLPTWLSEGLAEYFAAAHQGGGRFSFAEIDRSVREHLRLRMSPRDPRIELLAIGSITGLPSRGWIDLLRSQPAAERYQAYASALLLTHYHLHGGPARLETLREALERQPARGRGGQSDWITAEEATEIETAIRRYWSTRGLETDFRPALPRVAPGR